MLTSHPGAVVLPCCCHVECGMWIDCLMCYSEGNPDFQAYAIFSVFPGKKKKKKQKEKRKRKKRKKQENQKKKEKGRRKRGMGRPTDSFKFKKNEHYRTIERCWDWDVGRVVMQCAVRVCSDTETHSSR